MITPTVHINGTSRAELREQYEEARMALESALAALPHPHGRDYYPQGPDVIYDAMEQWKGWALKLESVLRAVEAISAKIEEP